MQPARRSAAPSRSRQAVAWLQAEPGFASLREQAARLAGVQADLERCAPGLSLVAVALERDLLVVGAAHAAVAAKVRQVEPTIVAGLAQRGWAIRRIRFKPQWRPAPGGPARTPKPAPGPRAIAEVAALAERIEDPGLRAALHRLAARHGG
jgi:hypothetical protein